MITVVSEECRLTVVMYSCSVFNRQ